MYQYEKIILDLLEQKNIEVKIADDEVRCCCPFHKEDNPSFSINLETGKYICFSGSCNEKGDIFSFVSKLTNRKYEDVKNNLNIENLKYINIVNSTLQSLNEQNKEINKDKSKIFSKNNYFRFVELSDLVDEQKILTLINVDKKISDIVKLKICLSNPYRNRLVVPIADNVYEFRDLFKTSDKKCLYESGIKISNYLFRVIVDNNCKNIFLAEGTKDAMSIASFGFNSCCTFGINISQEQITHLIKLNVDKVFIIRDNDEAGYKSSFETYKKIKNFIDCKIIKYPKNFKYKDPNEILDKNDFINLLKHNI